MFLQTQIFTEHIKNKICIFKMFLSVLLSQSDDGKTQNQSYYTETYQI